MSSSCLNRGAQPTSPEGEYETQARAGRERTPAFHVSARTQTWKNRARCPQPPQLSELSCPKEIRSSAAPLGVSLGSTHRVVSQGKKHKEAAGDLGYVPLIPGDQAAGPQGSCEAVSLLKSESH